MALVRLERQRLAQPPPPTAVVAAHPDAEPSASLETTLRAQQAELRRLQRRTDSLLYLLATSAGRPPAPVPADTVRPHPLAHRWSLQLAAAPEQTTLSLQGSPSDSLTALRHNHETGRGGLNASLLAEYQLTPRLSVGVGMGYSAFGAALHLTTSATAVHLSTTTQYDSTVTVRTMRRDSTLFIYRTVTIRKTTTPAVSQSTTRTTQLLQPAYRFVTLPVLLRYRLSQGPGRWSADVAGGAQLQFFLGGSQVVTDDGAHFRTEKVRPGEGPFRPVNVALSAALAVNYALTDRLSFSVAPSVRWQALSLYKPATGLRQQSTATGLQLGLRFRL